MTDELPDPPVPRDAELHDFQFTPMFRARLFSSRFHARVSDAGWRAGVTLWLKSWDQTPPGSLPDDDIDLCRLAELGRDLKFWQKIKKEAMWGWYKCSDGLLYHDVVAEGVNEAWMGKLRQRWGTECGRIKKANQRHNKNDPCPTFEQWLSLRNGTFVLGDTPYVSEETDPPCPQIVRRETPSKRERKGQRQRQRQRQGESLLEEDDDEDERGRDFAKLVFEEIGATPSDQIAQTSALVDEWLGWGADFDQVILPTIGREITKARRSSCKPGWLPNSLSFFDKAIQREMGRRTPSTERAVNGKPMPAGLDPRWPLRVKNWLDKGRRGWMDMWGPAPDQPKTAVPTAVLEHFGIGRAEFAAEVEGAA